MTANLLRTFSRGTKSLSIKNRNKIKDVLKTNPLSNQFNIVMTSPSDLIGRDLVSFENYRTQDIYSILWTALDLKDNPVSGLDKICSRKSISLLSSNPLRRIILCNAASKLGIMTSFINPNELDLDSSIIDYEILGKTIGAGSDLVIIDSAHINQLDAEKFAEGCTVPVINVESYHMCPIYCLAELMTLFEHYNRIRRLILSFVGHGTNSLLNTYALLLPKVGMHLHFLTDDDMDLDVWEKGVQLSAQYGTEFKQFDTLSENLYRTHVISSTEELMPSIPQITLDHTREMDLNWTVLQKNVHVKNSLLSRDLLRCKQSLIWKNIENQQWIFMATLIAITSSYTPTIERPQFEGDP